MVATQGISTDIQPVRKSVTVKAEMEHAFRVFTAGMDTWWPRTHHIGKTPMVRTLLEGHAGGRCYSEHEDGSQCDWGKVLAWEPPQRFVFAWQVSPSWQYEADLAKCSEVEVRFTREADGSTRVDLEHRHFERHGAGADQMRTAVDGEGGWTGMLGAYAAKTQE
jgi:uncharacterized protein YndB with AHSA1/START domain